MNIRTCIGLILFSVVTSIVGAQMLVVIPDEIRATNAWMLCDAVSKIMFVGAFWLHAKGTLKHLLFGVLFIAINNLVDELFFELHGKMVLKSAITTAHIMTRSQGLIFFIT